MANEVDYGPIKYVGNGSTVDFSFDWKVIDTDELTVELEEISSGETTTQTRGSDYTAAIDSVGGSVTFTTAPSSDYYVVLSRNTSQYQSKGYSTSTGFQGSEIEKSFDKVSCNLQEMDYNIENFKEEFTEEIDETISTFKEEVDATIAANKAELEEEVENFEDTVNSNLTQVYTAVEQLNRLDEVIEECESYMEAAETSSVSASESAASAEDYASLAKDWAVKTDDTVDGEEYSSKYYAQLTAATASAALSDITTAQETALGSISTAQSEAEETISAGITDIENTANDALTDIATAQETALSLVSGDYLPLAGNSEDTPVTGTVYLSKDGAFTYTDDDMSSITAKNTALDATATGYTEEYPVFFVRGYDKNGVVTGIFENYMTNADNMRTSIIANRTVDGTEYQSRITAYVENDGTLNTYAPASKKTNSIVTTAGYSQSQSGYYKFGNGFIVQWGRLTWSSSSAYFDLTFPTAFTSTHFKVIAMDSYSSTATSPDSSAVFNHAYYYAKTTGTRLLATETTLGAVDWLAVGY